MAAPPGTRPRLRRTWPQRIVLGANVVLVIVCGLAATLVWYANSRLGSLERVVITHAPTAVSGGGSVNGLEPGTTAAGAVVPAQNILLVGSDSRDCISAD